MTGGAIAPGQAAKVTHTHYALHLVSVLTESRLSCNSVPCVDSSPFEAGIENEGESDARRPIA